LVVIRNQGGGGLKATKVMALGWDKNPLIPLYFFKVQRTFFIVALVFSPN
jgi:hypothetical protein